ncbi:hypothetical protein ACI68E_002443 [Malassezia pachydermatis]|uniref:Uncharacterized protein n=1 Tax=Malassezia pachydermatis TaxID=77020 RepID=A0A0M8MVN5_9BASI|nr:hypothetical protein Malapachy_0744 [Malassezia pachydermatis]KOS14700.1 hypothetical protein Malapachy_0744 [Malassezia pachydermatis]
MASSQTSLARLLRRTRFNTYDPKIKQVYQTPVAHAVRGDWGLKRPLPSSWQSTAEAPAPAPYPGSLRYATVDKVDNAQGMTEWKESEREPLFRTRWHEAGASLSDKARRDAIVVGTSEDIVNSDLGPRPRIAYDPATCMDKDALPNHVVWGTYHERYTDKPDVLPNYNAMDEKTFQRFLSNIRRRRNKFREALRQQRTDAVAQTQMETLAQATTQRTVSDAEREQTKAPSTPAPAVDMWTEARLPHAPQSAAEFLQAQAETRYEAPDSHTLQSPAYAATAHPLRGLQYSQPDSVYSFLMNEPMHGRALHRVEDQRRKRYMVGSDASMAVAMGGHIGFLPLQHRHGLDVVDYTRAKPERGESYFRVLYASLETKMTSPNQRRNPPNVTCEPELGKVQMYVMALRRSGGRGEYVAPPLPGSPAWIDSAETPTSATSLNSSLGASSPEAGSLFGSLARNGRANSAPRQNQKRQRMQKRNRDMSGSVQRDVQMLNNIKNLLSPQ